MGSIQNKLLRGYFKFANRKKSKDNHNLEKTRKGIEKLATVSKKPSGVKYKAEICDGVNCEWNIPKHHKTNCVVLYLHGGAYASGSIASHRALVGRLARASKTKFISVDYRLAPEHPFPASLNDSIAVYHWLLKNNYTHDKIIIAGDSAGGGLALATVLKLRDEGINLPAATVCLSPWLDLKCTGDSAWKLVKQDPMLKFGLADIYVSYYAPDMDLKNPYLSPYYCNPEGLPPIYIQVSNSELVLDDSTRFEIKAKAAGVDIKLEIWDNMLHVWQAFGPILPEANKAIKKLGKYIEEKLH